MTLHASKIIPDLELIAIHLSGSNGVDCALDGADHIVDFETLQGLSHYNNTSTTPGATQKSRIVRRKDASWSLNWPSGANLLARKQHMYFFWCLCDYCVLVFLCYWESIN